MNNPKTPRLLSVECMGDSDFGRLAVYENVADAPFRVERVYWTYGVPPDQTRGMHAHRQLEQIIFALSGQVEITLENLSKERRTYELTQPHRGLYVPPIHWRTLRFSSGAVMMCLASMPYDEAEYIRDYAEFQSMQEIK